MIHIKGLTYFCHDILRMQCSMVNGGGDKCFSLVGVVCVRECSVELDTEKTRTAAFVKVLYEWPRCIATVRARTQCKAIHPSVRPSFRLSVCRANEVGQDSSVGITTHYGLDGPGIESRWGWYLPHPSRPARRPTQPPVHWVPGLSRRQTVGA